MMRDRSSDSGFTLIEILVAMVLLAAVGATALSSFSSSTQVVQSTNNTALNVARGYLENFYEYVRQDQYAVSTPSPLSIPPNPGGPLTQTLDGVTYTTNYTVTSVDIDGDTNEDYRRVDMTVDWP